MSYCPILRTRLPVVLLALVFANRSMPCQFGCRPETSGVSMPRDTVGVMLLRGFEGLSGMERIKLQILCDDLSLLPFWFICAGEYPVKQTKLEKHVRRKL